MRSRKRIYTTLTIIMLYYLEVISVTLKVLLRTYGEQ